MTDYLDGLDGSAPADAAGTWHFDTECPHCGAPVSVHFQYVHHGCMCPHCEKPLTPTKVSPWAVIEDLVDAVHALRRRVAELEGKDG